VTTSGSDASPRNPAGIRTVSVLASVRLIAPSMVPISLPSRISGAHVLVEKKKKGPAKTSTRKTSTATTMMAANRRVMVSRCDAEREHPTP